MKYPCLFFLLLAALGGCMPSPAGSLIYISLDGAWSFHRVGDSTWYPAIVPGTVHADLMRAGLIQRYDWRFREDSLQWIEREDWEYRTTFEADPVTLHQDEIWLDMQGLDTYADVWLNDSLILRADNMFRSWEKEVKSLIRPGQNVLRVYFHSPVKEGLKQVAATPYIVPANNELKPWAERTSSFTRKAPYHYGWDWGPRIVTSGIWRPVRLVARTGPRLVDVLLLPQQINADTARYQVRVAVQAREAGEADLTLTADGEVMTHYTVQLVTGKNEFDLPMTLINPRLWWPRGMGRQDMYQLRVELHHRERLADQWQDRLGVRTLAWVHEPDSLGHSFYLTVNGLPVFMKGANYIPPDHLNAPESRAAYERVIRDATDANMNMLRIWGGAIYENNLLYDLCDEAGLLIWQDFMFACAMYPGDSLFLENVRQEAVSNVRRLRMHPSLAIWCGNNENLLAWRTWDWQGKVSLSDMAQAELWEAYHKTFYEILPEVVKTYDPGRFYWPSSPSSTRYELPTPGAGDAHDWRVWFSRADFHVYGTAADRFVSEYGVQSYPDWETIRAFSDSSDWSDDSPVMRHRQRSRMPYFGEKFDGNDMIREYVLKYYPAPRDFYDLVYFSQLMQADALKAAIEAHRRNMPMTMGSLYWQIDDVWPTMSWSTVDYYGRWKAAHYRVRDAFAPRVVLPQATADSIWVRTLAEVPADGPQSLTGEWDLRLMTLDGNILHQETIQRTIPAGQVCTVWASPRAAWPMLQDSTRVLLYCQMRTGGEVVADNVLYFARPRALALVPFDLQPTVQPVSDGFRVVLTSPVLLKGVYLRAGVEGFFSDNYIDLLPGMPRTIHFKPANGAGSTQVSITARSLVDGY